MQLTLKKLNPTPFMSFETSDEVSPDGRRAAHVKWDGKTIALGTFSAQEAVEKCNRAKALTKKWRTTMIPKPDVEWVKTTLERLNIRVVNDRPGRRKKRGITEVDENTTRPSTSPATHRGINSHLLSASQNVNMGNISHDPAFQALNRGINTFGLGGDIPGRSMDRRFSNPTHYRMSSQERNLTSNNVLSSLPNPGNVYDINNSVSGFDTASNNLQQDQQLLSNVLRGDESQRISQRSNTTQQQLANLAFGSNQHYEVLKEHHMNLLKELHETTTLMSMYHNNTQNNIANFGSSLARNRNQEGLDPFAMEQNNLLMGSTNQFYSSPQSRSNSLGLGTVNMHMAGAQNYQLDPHFTHDTRRDSLRNVGLLFSASSNEPRNEGEPNLLSDERRRIMEENFNFKRPK